MTGAFAQWFNGEQSNKRQAEANIKPHSLLFNGKKLKWLNGDGKVVKEWDAVSGVAGTTAKDQHLKDKGPIPSGQYLLTVADLQSYKNISSFQVLLSVIGQGTWPWGKPAWGDYRIWLTPISATNTFNRRGFSIHGGAIAGSAGCIDLTHNMNNFVIYFRTYNNSMELNVNYEN